MAETRSVAAHLLVQRKVRATQSGMLPNGKSAATSRISDRKQPPLSGNAGRGKGEKVG